MEAASPGSASVGKLQRLAGPLGGLGPPAGPDRLAGPESWNTSDVKGLLLVYVGPLGWAERSGAGKGVGATPAFSGGASSLGGSAPFLPDNEFTWNGRGRGPFKADVPFGLDLGATDVVVSTGTTAGGAN